MKIIMSHTQFLFLTLKLKFKTRVLGTSFYHREPFVVLYLMHELMIVPFKLGQISRPAIIRTLEVLCIYLASIQTSKPCCFPILGKPQKFCDSHQSSPSPLPWPPQTLPYQDKHCFSCSTSSSLPFTSLAFQCPSCHRFLCQETSYQPLFILILIYDYSLKKVFSSLQYTIVRALYT